MDHYLRPVASVEITMVGLVRDIVIPVKGDPVLTIVCEILSTPSQNHPQQEEEVENPHITRLWKVRSKGIPHLGCLEILEI